MHSIKNFVIAVLLLTSGVFAQDAINIATRTRGNLPVSRIVPGVAGQCLTTDVLGHTNWGSCGTGGGSGTFPQSLANASHKWFNSYDSSTGLFTQTSVHSNDLADFSATAPTTAGKIPIYDPTATNSAGGTGAYVPGDPLVQGLFADGSTSVENPVIIGGYGTEGTPALHHSTYINGNPSGTEYGMVVRNVPSGTQPVSVASLPLPTGAATAAKQPALGTAGTPSSDVISVQGVASGTPVKTDSSATTQPVSVVSLPLPTGAATSANQPTLVGGRTPVDPSGVTSPVSVASLPLPSGAAQDSTLTGGNTKAINRGGAKGITTAADVTSTASGSNHQALDVAQYDAGGNQLGIAANPVRTDPTGTTAQPVSATSLPLPTGAATAANQSTVKAASTAATSTDTSSVFQLSPNQPQLTSPLNFQGAKTNNSGAPGANNIGTLPAVANVAPPSFTEANQGALSMDLAGNLRVYGHPPNVLGCYTVNGRTGTYTGLASGAILVSWRWTSSTSLAVLQRVKVNVITSTAATTAGEAERELHVVRSFTVSDTGGTAITMTGNNAKMRTSQATSAVGDFRFGQPLTAGTGTADANPVSSAVAWLPLNFTGVDIGCGGAAATGAVWSCAGGVGPVDLLNATNGQEYPLVFAQNEGWRITIGKDAMPAAAVQQTTFTAEWCEVSAY